MSNFKTALFTFVGVSLALWLAAFAADWMHPKLACLEAEKNYWEKRADAYRFERVSSFFWSSLCREPVKPVIITASEGTAKLSFAQAARLHGVEANEFVGAHKGLKTLAYMLASEPHSERLRNLRVVAFINPVYFSFAARTDASSVSLTSISNLSYVARLGSFYQKWDEFFLASLFIGAKSYLEELKLFANSSPRPLKAEWPEIKAPDASAYDFERHMLRESTRNYTTFRSKFAKEVEPAKTLFDRVVTFANKHPDATICYVMLPANLKNLRHFGRDADAVARDMRALIERLPEDRRVDLGHLSEEPYVFTDPMHLTVWGVKRVMDEVVKTPCAERVLGKAGG